MVPLHWRQLGHSSKTRWERRWEGGHSVLVWPGLDSGLHILKELLLVVQQELGKGVDGVDGFQGDGYIFGPQQIWAKHNCQVGVCHLVSVTVSRDLCGKERDRCESYRTTQ